LQQLLPMLQKKIVTWLRDRERQWPFHCRKQNPSKEETLFLTHKSHKHKS